jgi:hypothetical protein
MHPRIIGFQVATTNEDQALGRTGVERGAKAIKVGHDRLGR